jgi:hypothetical protein
MRTKKSEEVSFFTLCGEPDCLETSHFVLVVNRIGTAVSLLSELCLIV